MKSLSGFIVSAFVVLLAASLYAEPTKTVEVVRDYYKLKMNLSVPQVLDNMSSQGYRKIKRQKVDGEMIIVYRNGEFSGMEFGGFVNHNFKVGGKPVTYTGALEEDSKPCFVYIGNNGTDIFKTPTITYDAFFEPSYAIGEPSDDNSFVLRFSGRGTSRKTGGRQYVRTLNGSVAGTQGCGCADYGHKSPTRAVGEKKASEKVVDIASVFGDWKAVFSRTERTEEPAE